MKPASLPGAGLLGEDLWVALPDGRQLHAMVDGPDSDTLVVLEAGLGMSGLYWGPVHRQLSRTLRVVAYERAGIGASGPGPLPRNLPALSEDLSAVIDAVPHRRLVLVGHSWGGPIVRVTAARRLQTHTDLIGIVLADQTDENDAMFFSATTKHQFAAEVAMRTPLAELGILAQISESAFVGLPVPLRQAVIEATSSVTAAQTADEEERHVIDGLKSLRDNPPRLGTVPIRVISAQLAGRFERRRRAELVRAHLATAQAHPGAKYVPARGVGHMTVAIEPHWVCDAVLEVAATARYRGTRP